MKTLTEIAKKYNTDKGSYHTFTDFYAEHFDNIRNDVLSLLEIGILRGASLKMWHDYFINAEIYGIDIASWKHGPLNFNFDEKNLEKLNNFTYVKSGGYYILEDLHTSFNPKFTKNDDITTYDVVYQAQKTKKIIKTKYFNDEQHQYLQENIDQIIIYKKNPTVFTDSITCIIKKS